MTKSCHQFTGQLSVSEAVVIYLCRAVSVGKAGHGYVRLPLRLPVWRLHTHNPTLQFMQCTYAMKKGSSLSRYRRESKIVSINF